MATVALGESSAPEGTWSGVGSRGASGITPQVVAWGSAASRAAETGRAATGTGSAATLSALVTANGPADWAPAFAVAPGRSTSHPGRTRRAGGAAGGRSVGAAPSRTPLSPPPSLALQPSEAAGVAPPA